MADSKLSDLTAVSSVGDVDLLYVVQSGSSKKATKAQMVSGLIVGSTAITIGSISWVRRFKAQDLVDAGGINNSQVSSWTDKAGSGGPAVQATGSKQPLLKTNSLNSLAGVLFDGTDDYLATVAGGASMTGPCYVAVLFKFTSGGNNAYGNVIAWGDQLGGGERRSFGSLDNLWMFQNEGGGVYSGAENVPAVSTPYLLEYLQSSDGQITLILNGVTIAGGNPLLNTYSLYPLILGVNPNHGEPFNGTMYEACFLGSWPTIDIISCTRSYFASTYGISLSTIYPSLVESSNTQVAISNAGYLNSHNFSYGPFIVGGETPLLFGGASNAVFDKPAMLSVYGSLVAESRTGEHMLRTRNGNQNVLAIRNDVGYSTIRYLLNDGNEAGAYGVVSAAQGTAYGGDYGGSFAEYSNFSDSAHGGCHRRTQTCSALGGGSFVREEWDYTGYIRWYNVATYPNQVSALTITKNGSVYIGPDNGITNNFVRQTIPVNAASGHFGFPFCSGIPTGVPEVGTGAAIYDFVDNILYIYNNGWRKPVANLSTSGVTWQ